MATLAVELPALVSALYQSGSANEPNDGIGYIDASLSPVLADLRQFPVPERAVYRVSRKPVVTQFAESAEVPADPGGFRWERSGEAIGHINLLRSALESGTRRMVSGRRVAENEIHFVYGSYTDGDKIVPVVWEDLVKIEPVEARPAVGAYSVVTGKIGWDSGGQGKDAVRINQRFVFRLKRAVAVQAGLARGTSGEYSFAMPRYGWYWFGDRLETTRRGRTLLIQNTENEDVANWVFAIERRAGKVNWLYAPSPYDDLQLYGSEPDDGGVMFPVGMPYAVGDFVDAYGVETLHHISASIPLASRLSEGDYRALRTRLPGLSVAMVAEYGTRLVPDMPAVEARITELASGRIDAELPALGVDMRAEPAHKANSLYSLLPLTATMRGLAGAAGELSATVAPLLVRIEDIARGRINTALDTTVTVRLTDYKRDSGMDFLNVGFDHHLDSPLVLISVDGLNVGDSATVSVIVSLESAERLELESASSIGDLIELLTQEGLHLTDGGSLSRPEALQYAVNLLTGAPSVYAGFDFRGFVTIDGIAYGWKADGLYRIGADRDGETAIRALVDFGTTDYGTSQRKRVPAAWLGIRTDGQTYLKVRADDGAVQVYRARPSSETHKAILAKGVAGRQWSLTLEVEDASFASLDSIELEVAVTQRRFGGN